MSQEKIMIVEDDPEIRESVRILLESENFQICEAENGEKAIEEFDEDTDLVILDVMMPGISGIHTCEQIRKKSNVPILFLTAKAGESDKLIGFMVGGDDYLTKPFSYAELLGRVKALLRRYNQYMGNNNREISSSEKHLEANGIRINESSNEVFKDGKLIEMTNIEYRLLLLMMQNPRKVFSVQNLYESIWKEPFLYTSSNTVMVHIWRLRTKIEEDPRNPKLIKTIWGRGYRLDVDRQ